MRAYRVGNIHALVISELSTGFFAIKGDLTFATINKNTLNAIDCSLNGPSSKSTSQKW